MSNETAFAAINLQSALVKLMRDMSDVNVIRTNDLGENAPAVFDEGAFGELRAACADLRKLTVDSLPTGSGRLKECAHRLAARFPGDTFTVELRATSYQDEESYQVWSLELSGFFNGSTIEEAEAKCIAAFEAKAKAVSEVIAAQEVVELAQVEEEHVSTVTGA